MKCFLIEPCDEVVQYLIYSGPGCTGGLYHRAEKVLKTEDVPLGKQFDVTITLGEIEGLKPPVFICENCLKELRVVPGCVSSAAGRKWRSAEDGRVERNPQDFGVGAMWFAPWFREREGVYISNYWDNQADPPLIVATPGGEWMIDGRANNCTKPEDRLHRCWVRHGEAPEITVDKNGNTCSAGAGSIQCGNYLGFLQGGVLTP